MRAYLSGVADHDDKTEERDVAYALALIFGDMLVVQELSAAQHGSPPGGRATSLPSEMRANSRPIG